MDTEYRSTGGRALTILTGAVSAIALVGIAMQDGPAGLARYGGLVLLPSAIVWALFWRPRVVVDDGGVTVVNVLRTVRVPWPAIRDIDTRWALTLRTAYGDVVAWGAPSSGRYGGRTVSRREIRHLPEDRVDGGVRLGDSPHSPSGRAAEAIRARWEALTSAGHLDDPRLEFATPPVRWHVDTAALLGALAAWTVAGLLL